MLRFFPNDKKRRPFTGREIYAAGMEKAHPLSQVLNAAPGITLAGGAPIDSGLSLSLGNPLSIGVTTEIIVPTFSTSLMHFDSDLTDLGGTVWSASGGVGVSTAQSKFGGGSLLLGSGKYLSIAASNTTKFRFGPGSFAIDLWVYLNTMPTTDSFPGSWSGWFEIFDQGSPNAGDGWRFSIGQTKLAFGFYDNSPFLSVNHGLSTGSWNHLEMDVDRSTNTWYMFVNGLLKGSVVNSSAVPDSGSYFYIGSETGQGAYCDMYMDEFRITEGVTRHTSEFTPPTSAYTSL